MISYRKVFVEVTAKFSEEGKIIPLSIRWEDGRVYEIDRIMDARRLASTKSGGAGIRYLCRIQGKETSLFLEGNSWFVEAKVYD